MATPAPDWWTDALIKVIYGVRMVSTGDRWDHPGIRAAVTTMQTQVAPDDLAVAFIRGAANPKLQTPAGVAKPGPHWAETGTTPRVTAPECVDHPGQRASTCADCHKHATPPPPNWRNQIANIRQEKD